MSFDQDIMDELRATFFDECSEYLLRNEELLASLRGGIGKADERETLDAIFRIAHSIKAGAAAFGLSLLADLTHHLEAVLDRLRTGRLTLDGDLLALLLQSGDVLAAQVDAARNGGGADADAVRAMIGRLSQAAVSEMAVSGAAVSEAAAPAAAPMLPVTAAHAAQDGAPRRWAIKFRPTAYSGGNEPMLIIRALARLGQLVSTLDLTQLPDIEEFDPTEPVLAWRIELETVHSEDDIREIFEFVEDEADIVIEPVEPEEAAAAPPAAGLIPAPVEPAGPVACVAAAGPAPQRAPALPARVQQAAQQIAQEAVQGRGKGSIRVDLDRMDRLVDLVGELIITEAALAQVCQELDPRAQRRLAAVVKGLGLHSRKVQDAVMAIRMQPVKSIFARMPRMVRDLATRLGKTVEVATIGEMTEVDKTIIEELADPLTHMIRNAVDHGIEPAADRVAAGKPSCGTVTLSAENKGGRIVIRVEDDGRGIDRDRVLARARSLGLVPADAPPPADDEIDALLFAPGFSTSDTVTDVSGRGVGMDVVQRNIQRLGGRVTVQSEPGRGTRWTMSLPLTLAVLDGMLVRAGGELYVIPLANILDSTRPKPGDIREVVGHGTMVFLRGDWLPLMRLGDLFNLPAARRDPSQGIVVRVETEAAGIVGLLVDELLGQQQVVVKPFEQNFTRVRGIAATTILGNGRVCLILDLDDCVALSHATGRDLSAAACAAPPCAAE